MIHVLRMKLVKLLKPKEVPRKTSVQSSVSVIFETLWRHEDEKENFGNDWQEITGRFSLAYNVFYITIR